MKKITVFLLGAITLFSYQVNAQDEPQAPTIKDRVITTAVPLLLISGDARASGLGDQGVATPVDVYSQQWNPAKFAFAEKQQGVGLSYVPYLRELVPDINLAVLSYYNRFSDRSAVSASLRYFNQGEIELRETVDQEPLIEKPTELGLDISYALRLGEEISMAVTGRYIRSDLRIQGLNGDSSPASSFGVDVSAFTKVKKLRIMILTVVGVEV